MENKPTLRNARESAVKQLDHFLSTSRKHPNPEHGKIIRIVCTRAILDLQVARSIAQIADILEKAQGKLKEYEQTQLSKAA